MEKGVWGDDADESSSSMCHIFQGWRQIQEMGRKESPTNVIYLNLESKINPK